MSERNATRWLPNPDIPMRFKDWQYEAFRSLQRDCWQVSEEHGWHDDLHEHTFLEKLVLVHSELSEALEEYRDGRGLTEVYYREQDGKPEGVPVELADAIIRICDLAEIYGMDLAGALKEKQFFNETRPYRHGGKRV